MWVHGRICRKQRIVHSANNGSEESDQRKTKENNMGFIKKRDQKQDRE